MKLIADLHIHSHFSRATSRDLTFECLYYALKLGDKKSCLSHHKSKA